VIVLATRRPRALVISPARPLTNHFWVLYFKLLPSVGLLYAAFIPKAGRGKTRGPVLSQGEVTENTRSGN
jgi:hypothetical protein